MKRWKSCLIVSAFIALIVVGAQTALADETGNCGENVSWTLDGKGALTISGSGNMADYTLKSPSPFDSRDDIETVKIEDGVIRIGNYAFSDCNNLKSITLPSSVTIIGREAFCDCNSLTDVYYGGSKDQWNKIGVGEHVLVELKNVIIHYSNTYAESKVPPTTKKSITLNEKKLVISKGKKYKLIATVTGMNKTVKWTSSNKKIATVKDGIVTGKKKGTVTITAKCGKLKAKCKVVVSGKTKKNKTDVRNAYYKYIEINLNNSNMYPSAVYKFFDINNDGIDELIFRYTLFGRQYYIVLIYEEEAVHEVLRRVGPYCSYLNKGKGICFFGSDGASLGIYALYELKDNTLKEKVHYSFDYEHGDGKSAWYWKNSNRITKSDYETVENRFKKWVQF